MMELLVFKENLKRFYGKYSIYIIPIVKFVLGAAAFFLINSNIGFMERLTNPLVPVVMGLVASFVPCGATAFFAGCFIIVHVSRVSLEVALILCMFILAVIMLYYGFRPGDGYLLLLTPMLFFLKIPYVVPLIVGLSGSLVSIVPVSCGVCIYYIVMYMKQNAGVLAGSSVSELAERFIQIAKSVFGNELMWVMVIAFAAAILVVFIIKNLSLDYAWSIAIIAGVITELIVIFIGDFNYNLPVSLVSIILGILVSVILALIYQFFVFAVDYSRTEYLQYEDDEYHYYVKAVPKIAVSAPDVKVHRIYSRKNVRPDKNNQ
ncbi:MAG: ABC transporter permease [Lachnospiraceae bacterium]|nr:ABC transporter permease [Lachnospiraceae bacterium]